MTKIPQSTEAFCPGMSFASLQADNTVYLHHVSLYAPCCLATAHLIWKSAALYFGA